MSLTFNSDNYQELLTNYLPKVIKTEAENEQALAKVEALMHRKRTSEENEVYHLLITLIEKFEAEQYRPNQQTNPLSILLFLLEDSGKSRDDLITVLGSENVLNRICNGEKITSEQARTLGNFFSVEPSLFIEENPS